LTTRDGRRAVVKRQKNWPSS